MKTTARIAVVGVWVVLMAAAGGAVADVEPKSDPDDVYWSEQFPVAGAGGNVNAAVKDASGNIYIGGDFTVVGDIIAKGVAKWNVSSSTWSALGTGVEGGEYWPGVEALAVDGSGNVYAGGDFTTAGGVAANCIAKWNGTAWSALGTGMWGGVEPEDWAGVFAIAIDSSGNLYAGGHFITAGGVAANEIAKWDGTAWSALGTGVAGTYWTYVYALAVDGSGNVYAGGDFTTAGGVEAHDIAKWDGTAWSALGTGMWGAEGPGVEALAVDGSGNVYAGGDFTTAGGVAANHIAKWNGTAWSALGTGMGGMDEEEMVHCGYGLAIDGLGNLYAGGWFTTAGGVSAKNIAKWNGTTWSALGAGMDGPVEALAVDGSGKVYAGGGFFTAGGVPACCIASWDGMAWSALGSGINGPVYAFAVDGSGDVYAGGIFTTLGGVAANNIAKWDGIQWSALSTGMAGGDKDGPYVCALAVDGSGNVYAAGMFTTAGGVAANYIAKWDGAAWSALGTGMDDRVYPVAVDSLGNVYAGGWFTTAGGVAANYIAKWNGSAWSALGTGMDDYVWALAVDGSGNVYAGGWFTTAGGVAANYIAKWDGAAWSALGTGMGGGDYPDVYALALDGSGNLYAGGHFTTAGGVAANNIAKWDGTAWSALGTGMGDGEDPAVEALALDGSGIIYAGGHFTTAGGVAANNIAKWDGAAWSPLGTGMDNYVFALEVDGSGNLYAGGGFTTAGSKVSGYFALWEPGAVIPPNPPTVTGVTPTEDTTPTWTWTSGGGGNGTYRYQLDGTAGTWTQTTGSSYTPAMPLSEGAHTLYVQERNDDGDWSTSGSFEIVVVSPGESEGEGEPDDDGPPPGCFGG